MTTHKNNPETIGDTKRMQEAERHENQSVYKQRRIFMLSSRMPCGNTQDDLKMVEEVLRDYADELRSKASLENKTREQKIACRIDYEIMQGMDSIRVNFYGFGTQDLIQIGYNLRELQLLKNWRIK